MNIKYPPAYDIAGSYQRVESDWGKVNPKPTLVIHKATEGSFYRDPFFKFNFAGLAAHGIRRGAYHFFRQTLNSIAQANFFCDFVRDTLRPQDFIVLDMEEGGERLAQIFSWLDGVEAQYSNPIFIYSNKSKIDALAAQCAPAQLARLQRHKLWIAGYPYFPDLYASIASSYQPVGFEVWIWQYSNKGRVSGIVSPSRAACDVDLNWLHPEFIRTLGAPMTDGYQKLRRYNADVCLWRGKSARARVTNTGGQLETVSGAARRLQADYAVNGDGWLKDPLLTKHYPRSVAMSDGLAYQPQQYDFRPFLKFDKQQQAAISHNDLSQAWNVVSGTRYLVREGVNEFAVSTNPEHITELQPRTAAGYTLDGKLILCVADGRSAGSAGMTLRDLADVLIEAGARYALELDGGGSSAFVKGGILQNAPSDGTERAVVNHLLIYTGGTTMTTYTGSAKLTATPNVRIRQAYADGTANAAGTVIWAIQPGQAFKADLLSPDKAWLRITEAGGKTVLAQTGKPHGYSSAQYLDFQEVMPAPPTADKTLESLTIEPTTGATLTYLYSDGTVKKESV